MDLIDYALEPVFRVFDTGLRLFGKICGHAADQLFEIADELSVIERFIKENV